MRLLDDGRIEINGEAYDPDAPMNMALVTCKCGWTTIGNHMYAEMDWQRHTKPHPRKCASADMRNATARELFDDTVEAQHG